MEQFFFGLMINNLTCFIILNILSDKIVFLSIFCGMYKKICLKNYISDYLIIQVTLDQELTKIMLF